MKRFTQYILIFTILIGILSPMVSVYAQNPPTTGETPAPAPTAPADPAPTTPEPTVPAPAGQDQPSGERQSTPDTEFTRKVKAQACIDFTEFDMGGCIEKALYYVFYVVPAYLLFQTAYFFNFLISISLDSAFFKHPFVGTAWTVVRDLSNIFFILILLYVAIEMILGLGHNVQKMIKQVVLMALLINFSMFFTQIVIDGSNILARVFYSKLNVETKIAGESTSRDYIPIGDEKDIAGGMVAAFDPTTTLSEPFFKAASQTFYNGELVNEEAEVPPGTMIALILIAGLIMCFAIYALFVSGLSFVGRLIELWILIIFSPFAFMSSAVPALENMEYLGWKAWFSRLIKAAFMAPIFMFFLYFIFLLIQSDIMQSVVQLNSVGENDPAGIMKMLLGIVLPTLLILILLLKATSYAKKGSGAVGEMLLKGGSALVGGAMGLAVGAATGGAAFAGSNLIGRNAINIANNDDLRERAAKGGKWAQGALSLSNSLAGKSFDIRDTGVGKFATKKTGLNFNRLGVIGLNTESLKGGRKERDKEVAKKLDATKKSYLMTGDAAAGQDGKVKTWKENYEKNKQQAEKNYGHGFNESNFKNDYVNGKDLNKYGLTDQKGAKEEKSAQTINDERTRAYTNSLQYPSAKLDEGGNLVKDENGEIIKKSIVEGFGNLNASFIKGAANPKLLAATLGVAALAGPIAALGPILGGLSQIIKDSIGENKEIVSSVRKGVKSSVEEALHHLQEATGSHGATPHTNAQTAGPKKEEKKEGNEEHTDETHEEKH